MPPTDRFAAEVQFYVRYAETDAQGVVYHANYLIYMEEARTNYARVRGADYARFEKTGYGLVVTDAQVHYLYPARYGDRLAVRSWVNDLRSRTITFGYEIVNADTNQLLVTGETRHICLDRAGKVSRLPADWATLMR